jgi:hypothetical protein
MISFPGALWRDFAVLLGIGNAFVCRNLGDRNKYFFASAE